MHERCRDCDRIETRTPGSPVDLLSWRKSRLDLAHTDLLVGAANMILNRHFEVDDCCGHRRECDEDPAGDVSAIGAVTVEMIAAGSRKGKARTGAVDDLAAVARRAAGTEVCPGDDVGSVAQPRASASGWS